MKKSAIGLAMLMLVSIFAITLAIADESATIEEAIAATTAETASDVAEEQITTQDTIQEISTETENIAPSELAPTAQQRYAGVAKVTMGDGYIVKSDNSDAEKIEAFWVSAKYVSVDPAKAKEIREQYRGQPTKIKAELAKLATDKVVVKATGRISVSFGARKEKFKLLKKEFTNTSLIFYVLPINENVVALKDVSESDIAAKAVGELKINPKIYTHLTVWAGTLTLNTGKFTGTWTVTASSHARTFAKGIFGKVLSKPQGEPATVVKPQAAAKRSILNRIIFWRKATGNKETA